MNINKISNTETSILKALSILIIVLHNAIHPFFPVSIAGGNEFDFNIIRVQTFISEVTSNIFSLPNMLLAGFGYCGVFLFFFLSAYGISVKYGNKNDIGYWQFISQRITKILLPVLIVSVPLLLFLIAGGQTYGALKDITVTNFLLRLSMLSNFSFEQTWKVIGPWWFLSAIIQFYLVFHAINWGYKKFGSLFLIVISILSFSLIFFLNSYLYNHGIIALRATIIGWLPEISLGCYFAGNNRFINIRTGAAAAIAILSLSIFILGNFFEPIWIFSSMAILLFMLIIARPLLDVIKRSETLTHFLSYIGDISVYMFLLSGIIREPFVHTEDFSHLQLCITAMGLLALNFILSSILLASQKYLISFFTWISNFWKHTKTENFRLLHPELITIVALGIAVLIEIFFI